MPPTGPTDGMFLLRLTRRLTRRHPDGSRTLRRRRLVSGHARPRRPTDLQAKVLTVSDGVAAGEREDRGGAGLVERLTAEGYAVVEHRIVADGRETVGEALVEMADGFAGLIVTTGGTGFGPRDLTPEGTRIVLDREAPGLAEAMRLVSPLGPAVAGRGRHPGDGPDPQHAGLAQGRRRDASMPCST